VANRIQPTEAQWQAIINNDKDSDGKFFYAVQTTKIFCRPSCKSRPPKFENVRVFQSADEAKAERFRPCKRCKPTGERLPDHEWIELVTEYIDTHYTDHLSLDVLADVSHGSPYHLHRIFKRVKGQTPMEYIQDYRIGKAKEFLTNSSLAISDIGHKVGMENTAYFITLFKKKTGMTPLSYRGQYLKNTSAEVHDHEIQSFDYH
jgi:AraC family transcriptional regulator, regulatory protein of adaptative response / methylphosphotriester-DNA alkyltransferase methyltransferase